MGRAVTSARTRTALAALTAAVFAVGTDGFVFAGLLPRLSSEFALPIGHVAQTTTVFAVAYAAAAPLTAVLTGHWPRRRALCAALGVFAIGNVLTAVAPTFEMLLVSRVVAAVGAAGLTPTAAVTAAALVPAAARGRAVATVTSGLTLATAVGAPAGAALGETVGWRAAVLAIVALGLLAVAVLALGLPALRGSPPTGLAARIAPLRERRIRGLLVASLLAFVPVYLVYTYASVVYPAATDREGLLAIVLVAIGGAGVVGNLGAGMLADRFGPSRVVVAALGLVAAGAVLTYTAANLGSAIGAALVYGLGAFAITGPQQHRLLDADAARTGLPVALNAAAIYLAVAIAGVAGGVLTRYAPGSIAAAAAALAVIAAWWSHRLGPRTSASGV